MNEHVLDMAPGLKAYYDGIAQAYDEMKIEMRKLTRETKRSLQPLMIHKETDSIKKSIKSLDKKIDNLTQKVIMNKTKFIRIPQSLKRKLIQTTTR